MVIKLGSLFDGSGGFPLAGSLCGVEPVWAAEIEPYPIAVTKTRFPSMRHLGDISKVNGAKIEPVDIITFGSPCQDLSVAGKQAGIKHTGSGDEETTRSGLFMEAVRIIKEMRDATNGKYPTFALWENVPGAFSSNKGEDFRTVLEELIRIPLPGAVMPPVPRGGWAYADSYTGDGWSLAYRVFDAQYWGVPQRRRRIHLVLDLRGERAREVLFECEGLRGYFTEGRTPWQGAASDAEGSLGADDRAGADRVKCLTPWDCQSKRIFSPDGCYPTPQAMSGGGANNTAVLLLDDQGGSSINVRTDGKAPTLRAETHGNLPCVMESADTPFMVEGRTVYCLQGNGIDRADTAGCNGKGVREGVCYTLNTIDRPAVAFQTYQKVTGPLMANSHPGSYTGQDAFSDMLVAGPVHVPKVAHTLKAKANCDFREDSETYGVAGVDCRNATETPELNGTLQAKPNGCFSANCNQIVRIPWIVRRLTPTECARLQGFADRWGDIEKKDSFTDAEWCFWSDVRNTHAAITGKAVKSYTKAQMLTWYNKLHTDSAEYKMWGNGIALPPALYCLQGMVDVLEQEDDAWLR